MNDERLGECPKCGGEYAVDKHGKLYTHKRHTVVYPFGRNIRTVRCDGSGGEPK